jgi:hypothetical protein
LDFFSAQGTLNANRQLAELTGPGGNREIEKLAMEVITVLPILLIIDLFWWLR